MENKTIEFGVSNINLLTKTLAVFSIKDIEAVSGIKCHTLRIWEQRYGILRPKRTDTNIRYYDDKDLKDIINISILNREGYRISEIAKMSEQQIREVILRCSNRESGNNNEIKELVSAMLAFDEYRFHHLLTTNMIEMGVEQAMIKVVFPFLNEVGILWQIGSVKPCHEHFASGIIKQKLYVAIDSQVRKNATDRKKFLLFLPEGEQHCISLLFASYMLRARGHEVLYLGQEVPVLDLKDACECRTPDYVFTISTAARSHEEKQLLVNTIASNWPSAICLLSGIQFLCCDLQYPPNVKLIRRTEEFIALIDSLSE